MLDYFLYASGELAVTDLFDVRLGSQVINWGEATFTSGINGLQNRADLIARNTPGVEVKEILLPTGALYGQVDLVPDLTFEAYYQYEWKKTELNGVGSYFSDRDFLGPGARNFLIPVGPTRTHHRRSQNADEAPPTAASGVPPCTGSCLGIPISACTTSMPTTRRRPTGSTVRGRRSFPDSYTIVYFEDIQGYAASFTTVLADTNVQGEVSYKTDVPVVL